MLHRIYVTTTSSVFLSFISFSASCLIFKVYQSKNRFLFLFLKSFFLNFLSGSSIIFSRTNVIYILSIKN